jgi:N-acetylglucosamine malate deacetylase 2
VSAALAVIAHPDDESFGLGALLSALQKSGAQVGVVCFTHGEATTLGIADLHEGRSLHQVRAEELARAARTLGATDVELHDYPDGRLAAVSLDELSDRVVAAAARFRPDLLLAFDEGGVTGHPDHHRATQAALAAGDRLDLPVLGWGVRHAVAAALNAEFGTAFVGRGDHEIWTSVRVDRTLQLAAIACHRSQSTGNPVLWRRLELTGSREPLRLLRPARWERLATGPDQRV